jgi:hypothetical protein
MAEKFNAAPGHHTFLNARFVRGSFPLCARYGAWWETVVNIRMSIRLDLRQTAYTHFLGRGSIPIFLSAVAACELSTMWFNGRIVL